MNEATRQPSESIVFLAHSRGDKKKVRDFYSLLRLDGFHPWLDEENLVPGQDWELEIGKALKRAGTIVVFLSSRAIDNAGYVHKEIRVALEAAERLPEGSILLIPILLEDCNVPQRLRHLHWIDFSKERWRPLHGKAAVVYEIVDKFRPFSIGSCYLQLQRALLVKEHATEHPTYSSTDLTNGWRNAIGGRTQEDRVIEYLLRGQYSAGDLYYGLASMRFQGEDIFLRASIGAEVHEYKGRIEGVRLRFTGAHEVEYWMSYGTDLLVGIWGEGGLEELIPARKSTERNGTSWGLLEHTTEPEPVRGESA